jgi:hypothetical protein
MGIIEELQKNHNDKILNLQKSIEEVDNDKQEIGRADKRMGGIKIHIETILKNSQ